VFVLKVRVPLIISVPCSDGLRILLTAFKNLFQTSQKTRCIYIKNTSGLLAFRVMIAACSEQSISVIKLNHFMLLREIIASYSKSYTKYINAK